MSIKKYISLNKLFIFLDNLRERFVETIHTHTISEIVDLTIDNTVGNTSNLVKNSAINSALEIMRSELSQDIQLVKNYTDTEIANLFS